MREQTFSNFEEEEIKNSKMSLSKAHLKAFSIFTSYQLDPTHEYMQINSHRRFIVTWELQLIENSLLRVQCFLRRKFKGFGGPLELG